ncbi:hypothetical protein L7F22_001524 [Adiantum nelumboides]|nr:hypothetical protein [Adiantum nelumboides]
MTPLTTIQPLEVFMKWGLDFMGPFKKVTPRKKKYIVMATWYVSKWVEAKALPNSTAKSIAWFLYEHIICRYECPIEIVSDQGTRFINDTIEILIEIFSIKHRKSTPYYPRCNGQANSSSKTIKTILTKIVHNEPHNWDEQLQTTLWAYKTAYKVTTGMKPFRMVYGTEVVVPLEFIVPSLRMAKQYEMDFNTICKARLEELQRLDEIKQRALLEQQIVQQRRKYWHDRSGEILDDVLCYGNHDVIWCFLYERLVSTYVNIKSNNKESEISFTNFHRRRLLTWILAQIHKDKDDILPHQRLYKELHLALIAPAGYVVDSLMQHECQAWHKHGILKVSSVLKAKDLWSALLSNEIDYPCGDSIFDKRIIIGPKRQKWRELSRAEQRFLSQRECRSTHVQEHNKIWYNGEVFKGGDMVIVKSDNYIPGSFSVGEWKARIKYFFSAQCGAKLMLFFAADYYKQSILVEEESERLNVEPITGMSVLQQNPMPFTWDCIREVNSLLHKFISWSFENSIIAYEIKDLSVRKRLLDVGSVGCVPPWKGEMYIVQIKECDDCDSSTHTFAYAVVQEVDVERRKCAMTQNGRLAPSYADIFCPTKPKLRDPGRLYGKKLLEVYYKDHYPAFLQNYRDVRKWFKDYPFVSDLRHNLEEHGKIKALIEEKKGNLAEFEFQDAAYTWASDDIYQFVISYAQSQRKYDKKKCSKPVCLASNASQGEHDPKNGNLDLNVAMIEEESHSGSGHESTPTTMNLENLDSELKNNLEHQSFVSLLTSGNLKRVRAIPQSPKMGMTSQLVSKPTSAPLQVLQQDGESTRKSKRERKMSAKLRNSVTGKKPRLLSKKKKRQDIDNLNEDTTMRFVEHINGENSSYLSNDTIHDKFILQTNVEVEDVEDEMVVRNNGTNGISFVQTPVPLVIHHKNHHEKRLTRCIDYSDCHVTRHPKI